MMVETTIGIVGIAVTLISIIVTLINIRQSCGKIHIHKSKHQKSNRRSAK